MLVAQHNTLAMMRRLPFLNYTDTYISLHLVIWTVVQHLFYYILHLCISSRCLRHYVVIDKGTEMSTIYPRLLRSSGPFPTGSRTRLYVNKLRLNAPLFWSSFNEFWTL